MRVRAFLSFKVRYWCRYLGHSGVMAQKERPCARVHAECFEPLECFYFNAFPLYSTCFSLASLLSHFLYFSPPLFSSTVDL
jgi:hypothetical protein